MMISHRRVFRRGTGSNYPVWTKIAWDLNESESVDQAGVIKLYNREIMA